MTATSGLTPDRGPARSHLPALTPDQQEMLDLLAANTTLLTARGLAEQLRDAEPAIEDVLHVRDTLESLVAAGLAVTTRQPGKSSGHVVVYGLREFFPEV